ncbi:MAG TPA: hypothetical protein PKA84_13360, partial [Rubrivivax sp.]|nr:hypothetical protein [Rubrivivax sp.]
MADRPPVAPPHAEQIGTACDYCVVGCAYRVWRWPADGGAATPPPSEGTPRADEPPWANPAQHNIVAWQGRPHHVLVLPDPLARAVNPGGGHSMRGGTLAQKCHHPGNRTRERLTTPLLRVGGTLREVSWDDAIEVMARVSQHVLAR